MRYYDPDAGRFVNQDPIGLEGGDNIYLFSPNIQSWIDPLGLLSWNIARKQFWKAEAKKERDRIAKEKAKNPGSNKAHEAWNLSIVTPCAHAAMDPFRHTGSVLLKILKGTSTW